MSNALTFHVPPDASPEAIGAIFQVLQSNDYASVPAAVLKQQVSKMLDKQFRGEALALLRDLDLVAQTAPAITLTPRGVIVSRATEMSDLVHGLSYFAWSDHQLTRLNRMWTYRTVVDLLWERAPLTVDPALKKRLVEDLLARAESVFAETCGFSTAHTSIGPKSVDGVLRWLEKLTPPILHDRQLNWRQRCAPLLMVLALCAIVSRAEADPQADFRLGPEDRAALCHACFLDPSALDAMLGWTVQTQPRYVRWGTLNARYGRQVVITSAWAP